MADFTHEAIEGLRAHAATHGIIVLRGDDALDLLALARRGLPPRSIQIGAPPGPQVEFVVDGAVFDAEMAKTREAIVANATARLQESPPAPRPPCHLPLVALEAGELCPQCEHAAGKHRNWKAKSR